jgi:hypothetical protein
MSIDYHNDVKTTRMTAVLDAIDAGGAIGTLELCTAAYAGMLVSIDLVRPCGVVLGDPAALEFSGVPLSGTAAATGTAAAARIKDSAGKIIVSGLTVGAVGSGANIEIDSVSISNGQVVNLTSGLLIHG